MPWYITALIKILIDNNLIPKNHPQSVEQCIHKISLEFHRLFYCKDIFAYKSHVYIQDLLTQLEAFPEQSISIRQFKSLLKIDESGSKTIGRIHRHLNRISSFHKSEAIKQCILLHDYCLKTVKYFPQDMNVDLPFLLNNLSQLKKTIAPILGETNRYMNLVYTRHVAFQLFKIKSPQVSVEELMIIFKFKQGQRSRHFEDILVALNEKPHPNDRAQLARCQQFYSFMKEKIKNGFFEATIEKNELINMMLPLVDYFDFPLSYALPLVNQFKSYCQHLPQKEVSSAQFFRMITSQFLVAATTACTQPTLSPINLEKLDFIKKYYPAARRSIINLAEIWGQHYLFSLLKNDPHQVIALFEKNTQLFSDLNHLNDYLFYLDTIPYDGPHNHFCLAMLKKLCDSIIVNSTLVDKSTLRMLIKLSCEHIIVSIKNALDQSLIDSQEAEIISTNLQQLIKRHENFGLKFLTRDNQSDLLWNTKQMLKGSMMLLDHDSNFLQRMEFLKEINDSLNILSGTHYSLRTLIPDLLINHLITSSLRPKRKRSITIDSVENFIRSPRPLG